MDGPRVLIAASGTGGHIFPAIQIAKALRAAKPEPKILFVGSGRPLEEKLIEGAGFERRVIDTVGVKRRGPFGLFQFIITLPKAICQTWKLISEFQPQVVVGVGGYVSVLPVLIARLRGRKCWIHEAELSAGMANGFLSFFAHKVSLAFAESKLPCMRHAVYTGHPIRQELLRVSAKQPTTGIRKLLVMGGSQGARALDEALASLAAGLATSGLEIWHQARQEEVEKLKYAYAAAGVQARVDSFIDDVTSAYQWADLIICRAGAGTVMEIEAVNIPTIFVPYPFAQGNHQAANAATLARKGKALVVEEGERFVQRLHDALQNLLMPANYNTMLQAPTDARSLSAAGTIAQSVLALCPNERQPAFSKPHSGSR